MRLIVCVSLTLLFSSCVSPITPGYLYYYRSQEDTCMRVWYDYENMRRLNDWHQVPPTHCDSMFGIKRDKFLEEILPKLRYKKRKCGRE